VELEGIRTITMSGVLVKVLREIDDLNGLKGTFLKAATITITRYMSNSRYALLFQL
jgi:hypothetical protein